MSINQIGLSIFKVVKRPAFLLSFAILVWLIFFDRYNLLRRYRDLKDLKQAQKEKEYFEKQSIEVRKNLNELFSDETKLEKFAREHYFMKRDSEDVYIVVNPNEMK
ncbi:MAG: septum formation initiator family protein [Bacteroidota bacterium]|nr:septum formation initiator family protein [Bacteroidota bacterium]